VSWQYLSSLNAALPEAKRYGLAVVSLAQAPRLAIPYKPCAFRGIGFPFFQFAIALTVRFPRPNSGILAVVLTGLLDRQLCQFFHTLFDT
jgi:hypothetical protein